LITLLISLEKLEQRLKSSVTEKKQKRHKKKISSTETGEIDETAIKTMGIDAICRVVLMY